MRPTENPAVSGENFLGFFMWSGYHNRMIGISCTNFARSSWRSKFDEKFGVNFRVFLPLRGDIIFVVDRLNWADGLARTAVHALVRLYVEHSSALIDAINWALFDARLIFHIDTRLCNYVRQGKPPGGQVLSF
jgi:hypothetical protein